MVVLVFSRYAVCAREPGTKLLTSVISISDYSSRYCRNTVSRALSAIAVTGFAAGAVQIEFPCGGWLLDSQICRYFVELLSIQTVVNISSSIVTRIHIYPLYPVRSSKINDESRRHFDFDRSRIEIVYLKTLLPIFFFLRFLPKDRKIFLRLRFLSHDVQCIPRIQQREEELRFVHIRLYYVVRYYEIIFVVRSILIGLSFFEIFSTIPSWHFQFRCKSEYRATRGIGHRLRWIIMSHGWHDFSILNIYYTIYNFKYKEEKKFLVL